MNTGIINKCYLILEKELKSEFHEINNFFYHIWQLIGVDFDEFLIQFEWTSIKKI